MTSHVALGSRASRSFSGRTRPLASSPNLPKLSLDLCFALKQSLSGSEWCSCVTTQRPRSLRSPTVRRRRLSGSSCSSAGVPQRNNACAKPTSTPAVTSSETISNEAPCSCHLKKGGHVSRHASRPRTPSLGGGTSKSRCPRSDRREHLPAHLRAPLRPTLDQCPDLSLSIGHDLVLSKLPTRRRVRVRMCTE